MMSLDEQVIAIIFSFIYGGILSLLYNFNYNLLFNKRKIFRVVFNVIFIFDLVLVYFLIMKKINNAIIHPYFYLSISLGFFCCFNVSKKFRNVLKDNSERKKSD